MQKELGGTCAVTTEAGKAAVHRHSLPVKWSDHVIGRFLLLCQALQSSFAAAIRLVLIFEHPQLQRKPLFHLIAAEVSTGQVPFRVPV